MSRLKIGLGGWKCFFSSQTVSPLYRQWRDQLIRRRFGLGMVLAFIYLMVDGVAGFYEVFINPQRLQQDLDLMQLSGLLQTIRQNFVLHKLVVASLLAGLGVLWNSVWGRRWPGMMLVLMPWAIAFIPEMLLGAVFGIPRAPSIIMFMAQGVLVPVHWRLHLMAQIVPISFYFGVYPILGLGVFAGRSIYRFSDTVQLVLVCVICELGVYLYEQSKQAELEANQRLERCIHGITHDLRTPVMGGLMLLKSIQNGPTVNDATPHDASLEPSFQISRAEMTQLIQGSDRLLQMMNALLVPHRFSGEAVVLHCQTLSIGEIVAAVLQQMQPEFSRHGVQVQNQIAADLPLVDVDEQQMNRVLHNLFSNVIHHNPKGITLALNATRIHPQQKSRSHLMITVQDNGVGIPFEQQAAMFEAYSRGPKTHYQPGLGLGLYLCRQIVEAHGGRIGLRSATQGLVVWFTLPMSE
jgi:signal transduction histidine kinase